MPAGVVSGTVSIRVDEDELSTASGDNSTGITDGDADTDEATFTSASFAAVVTPGADEDAKFALNLGASGNVVTTGGAPVLSQGANVVWGTSAGALVGFVNLGGGAGFDLGIRPGGVRVTDDGSGTFTFDLRDQIDHTRVRDDNGNLILDLSSRCRHGRRRRRGDPFRARSRSWSRTTFLQRRFGHRVDPCR